MLRRIVLAVAFILEEQLLKKSQTEAH